jgi:hypothetical protein
MKKQNFGHAYYEKIYDLPTSPTPVPSGYIDWQKVAIYTGIAVGATIVFAIIIVKAQERQSSRWILVTEDMHKKHQEAQDQQRQLFLTIASELRQRRDMNRLAWEAKAVEIVDPSETIKTNIYEN